MSASMAGGPRTRGCLALLAGASAAVALAVARRRRRLAALGSAVPECDLLGVLLGDWPLLHLLAHRGLARLLRSVLPLCRPGAAASDARWTALHCAASAGHVECVEPLLRAGGHVDERDALGHTALAMAAARGHTDVALRLLAARADASAGPRGGVTPLLLASAHGDAVLVSALLERKAEPEEAQTKNGSTPLLAACKGPRGLPAVRPLLEAGAEANAACRGARTTPLMLLAEWRGKPGAAGRADEGRGAVPAAEAAALLLKHGADPYLVDHFGLSALHRACRDGDLELVAALCAGGAQPAEQDNDGMYPLQVLCQRCVDNVQEESELVDIGLRPLLAAEPRAATLLDFGDASALHMLCQFIALRTQDSAKGVYVEPPLKCLRELLAAKADVSLEEEGGWTAPHFLAGPAQEGVRACKEALAVLQAEAHAEPGFWEGFDASKPRNKSNTKYLARRGGHHRLPPEDRFDVLRGDVSLAGIAARLREGRSRRVVVLLGAGASTAAGIPDFRSAGGLWTIETTKDLFSWPGFLAQPEAFWRKAFELFEGRQPTKVHKLLAELGERDLLVRAYTQNIDGLEEAAGVPSEMVVECHGTMRRAICCGNAGHRTMAAKDIMADAQRADAGGTPWEAPRCSVCGELMRPDIVFFGEGLPQAYHRHWGQDLQTCDLLLVIGTSLTVYPVAGLVKQVGPLVPRLLINRERAGVWRERGSENYRDACWEGDCDAGAEEFARLLGWTLA
uniref:Deacetylase sirtuin-type domain-containing protein n=1 Tax=Alexandrium monilatum TaxID=311494 RepID=A0A7S4RQP1_9DINO|mmetsp:Transcript_65595/g.203016  ORF Transcript_65595/g.203016 Transcript_65595/m.203016 type:complete len:737 (-) Transcript_65595:55-2265(-)